MRSSKQALRTAKFTGLLSIVVTGACSAGTSTAARMSGMHTRTSVDTRELCLVMGTADYRAFGIDQKASTRPAVGGSLAHDGESAVVAPDGSFSLKLPCNSFVSVYLGGPDYLLRPQLVQVGGDMSKVHVQFDSLCPELYGTWYVSRVHVLNAPSIPAPPPDKSYNADDSIERLTWSSDGTYYRERTRAAQENDGAIETRGDVSTGYWKCQRGAGKYSWTPSEWTANGQDANNGYDVTKEPWVPKFKAADLFEADILVGTEWSRRQYRRLATGM